MRRWLSDLKDLGVSPGQITGDHSKTGANTINRTWNESVAVHLCAWQKKHQEKIVVDDNEDKRTVISAIFTDIRDMMYEHDRN